MTDGADEIPSASLYLASDAAAFMTWSAGDRPARHGQLASLEPRLV